MIGYIVKDKKEELELNKTYELKTEKREGIYSIGFEDWNKDFCFLKDKKEIKKNYAKIDIVVYEIQILGKIATKGHLSITDKYKVLKKYS